MSCLSCLKLKEVHTYKAPMYWSVYEYCYELEQQGVPNEQIDITPEEWDKIIDWVATDLKPHGYDMVCTDGFIPMLANDASGYMTHYGSMELKALVAKCKAKGLKVGVYDNPLWIHGPNETKVEGTGYTFGQLYYNHKTPIINPSAETSGSTGLWPRIPAHVNISMAFSSIMLNWALIISAWISCRGMRTAKTVTWVS